MKILMLSWEYPPKCVGGLSTHVYYLSHNLIKENIEVHIITCADSSAEFEQNDSGVIVHRVEPLKLMDDDFIKWIMHLNFSMIEKGIKLLTEIGDFDVIHAHDWLSAYSAKVLKDAFNIPFIATIHATENGRNNGLHNDMQRYISSVEQNLCNEAIKVVACSKYMKEEIKTLFNKGENDIIEIPNGIDKSIFDIDFDKAEFRKRYAQEDEKIVLYVGRHVYEKGIHLLVEASREIVCNNLKTKFVIVGKGPMTEGLKTRVFEMGLEQHFIFTGYMDDESKNKLYVVANVAVFPSTYEPFGIVALEAMAAGCPVVVSNTGGLSEIVEEEITGLKSINCSSESIGEKIIKLLNEEELVERIKRNALEVINSKYSWEKVAKETALLYNEIIK